MLIIKRTITFFLILIAILFCNIFAACNKVYSFEEVKQEFSQYEADLNTVVVLDDSNLYFYDRTIRLKKIVPEEYVSNFKIIDNYIYFSAKDHIRGKSYTYVLYRCDLYGNNLEWLFKKDNLKSPEDTFNGNILYFQYEKSGTSERIIDSYNLLTGEFANVARGEDCDIKNYNEVETKKYTFEYAKNKKYNKKFSINDIETSETFVGDEDYLKLTPYYKSLSKYSYGLDRIRENKGKLYLIYRLWISDFFDLSPTYTFVVFEFNFETKELIYKSIVQMFDTEYYSIINIEG